MSSPTAWRYSRRAFPRGRVRMRFGHHSRRMAILGLPPQSQLQRLLDDQLRFFQLPSEGLVLSAKLGELLDVQVGDLVTVEVLEASVPCGRCRSRRCFPSLSACRPT